MRLIIEMKDGIKIERSNEGTVTIYENSNKNIGITSWFYETVFLEPDKLKEIKIQP